MKIPEKNTRLDALINRLEDLKKQAETVLSRMQDLLEIGKSRVADLPEFLAAAQEDVDELAHDAAGLVECWEESFKEDME